MDEPEPLEKCSTLMQTIRKKRRFLFRLTAGALAFYFLFPFLVSFFPEWMNGGRKPWLAPGWAAAFAQFFLVWGVGFWYIRQAKKFDRLIEGQEREEEKA